MYHVVSLAFFAALASACSSGTSTAQAPYAQCGGENFSGGTTCVAGWTCVYSNPWYSQCLPAPSQSTAISTSQLSTQAPPAGTPSTTTEAVISTPASTSAATASTSIAPSGQTFKASFTHYGAGDSFGSPNCQTDTAACGFFTSPGFAAAVSQNLYGAGPGAGAGPACGTCWQLVGETDSSGNALTNAGTTIIVMVNNLCPAEGNPLCAQNSLTGTNQYGANVNFDLCSDSGAATAFFGNDGVGLAVGTATEVSCSDYSGTIVH